MHIATKISCLAGIALITGCSTLSSLNPFASKKAPRNPPAPLVEFKPSMSVRTLWSAPIGSAGTYSFTPALAGGSVYAAATDGSLGRFDAATGNQVWRIKSETPFTAGVGTDGNTIAVGAAGGVLLAYDATGKQRWKTQASSEILSAPAVGQGLVIVRSVDNRIVAYDAESGTRRWSVQRTVPPLTLRSAPGIVIMGPTVFVGMPGGRLLALAMNNGGVRWEAAVGDPRGATELERIADVSGMPVIVGRDICAAAYQGRVGCVDAVTGAGRWAKEFSSDVGIGADDKYVFAADERGILNAFTADTGASVWRNDKLLNRRLSAPAAYDRAVAVGDAEGYVHFLSRDDGSFLGRTSTDGSAIMAAPLATGNSLILQTKAGTVLAVASDR